MKNKILVGLMTFGLLGSTTSVYAMGNATVSFDSSNTVNVGDTFTVKMNVEDITDTYDGIVSMGGNLSFDSTKIEYISSKGIETPYQFQINENYNYKIAGLDFTLDNGIKNNLTVYEFTFRALEEGNTTITLANAKLTDSQEFINTNVVSKEINIINRVEENRKNIEVKPVIKTKTVDTKVSEAKKETIIELEKETHENKVEEKETHENKVEEKEIDITNKQINNNSTQKENVIEKVINNITILFNKILNLFK